jgi:hypothetical protein
MSDAQIRKNMEEQLTRLLNQLQDLESMKAELDEEEYASTKKDTLEQLDEFRYEKKIIYNNIKKKKREHSTSTARALC